MNLCPILQWTIALQGIINGTYLKYEVKYVLQSSLSSRPLSQHMTTHRTTFNLNLSNPTSAFRPGVLVLFSRRAAFPPHLPTEGVPRRVGEETEVPLRLGPLQGHQTLGGGRKRMTPQNHCSPSVSINCFRSSRGTPQEAALYQQLYFLDVSIITQYHAVWVFQ